MTENVNSEISNLFQELIVSKIKTEIDRLDGKVEVICEDNKNIFDSLDKCPKKREIDSVSSEVNEAKDNILESLKKLEEVTEKYLKYIVDYLKKQYQFPEEKELWEYLDNVLNELNKKLENVSDDECIKICRKIARSLNQFEKEMREITESKIVSELQDSKQKIVNFDGKITDITKKADLLLAKTEENEKEWKKYYNQVASITSEKDAIQETMIEWKNKYNRFVFLVKWLLIGEGICITGIIILLCNAFIW